MSIYSYNTARSLSSIMNLRFIESPEFSDQVYNELLLINSENTQITTSFVRSCAHMSDEEKKLMTVAANKAKRGMKETTYSRRKKSIAQKKRWSSMSDNQRVTQGLKSRNGISEDGKIRQTIGMNKSFSPVRQKGFKQSLITCKNCGKIGGAHAMKRFHGDNCKLKCD